MTKKEDTVNKQVTFNSETMNEKDWQLVKTMEDIMVHNGCLRASDTPEILAILNVGVSEARNMGYLRSSNEKLFNKEAILGTGTSVYCINGCEGVIDTILNCEHRNKRYLVMYVGGGCAVFDLDDIFPTKLTNEDAYEAIGLPGYFDDDISCMFSGASEDSASMDTLAVMVIAKMILQRGLPTTRHEALTAASTIWSFQDSPIDLFRLRSNKFELQQIVKYISPRVAYARK